MYKAKTYDQFLKDLYQEEDGAMPMTRPAMVGQAAPMMPQMSQQKMIQPQSLPTEDELQQILGMSVGAKPINPKAMRPTLFGKKYIG